MKTRIAALLVPLLLLSSTAFAQLNPSWKSVPLQFVRSAASAPGAPWSPQGASGIYTSVLANGGKAPAGAGVAVTGILVADTTNAYVNWFTTFTW